MVALLVPAVQGRVTTALVQRARYLRPALRNRPSLGRGEACPLGLSCRIRINVQEPTEHPKIGLMKDEGGGFPKAIVQPMFQIMLRRTEHCP